MLTRLATGTRITVFDEADAVCFIRDAYDRQIASYLGIIDETDQFIAEISARTASNAPAANQDGADAA
jgi:hypothetical protein